MHKLENWLLQLTRFFLFAALASPLVTSIKFFFPYITPAIFFFQLCVAAAAICFCILIICNQTYLPPINKLTIALTLFFVIQGLLVFTSTDPTRSFMGSVERMGGFGNLLHFYIFFIIAMSVLATPDLIKKTLTVSILVSCVVSLRYIIFNIDLSTVIGSNRYSLGNPGFLANYIVLHLPFALWLAIDSKMREVKIGLGLFIILQSITILYSGNRASFLGLAAFFLLAGIYFISNYKKIRVAIICALITLGIAFGILLSLKNTHYVQNSYTLWKLTNWSLNDATIKSRFAIWGSAWQGFKEKPIFGWGRDNFYHVFDKYYNPAAYNITSAEQWIDRAHNILLDELIAGGIITVIAELILLMLLITALWRLLKQKDNDTGLKSFGYTFLTFLATLHIQLSFTLNSFGTYLSFFIVFFAVNTITIRQDHAKSQCNLSRLKLPIFSILGLLIIIGTWNFTVIPALANHYAAKAVLTITPRIPLNIFADIQQKLDNLMPDASPMKAELLALEGLHINLETYNEFPNDKRMVVFQEAIISKLQLIVNLYPDYLRLRSTYASILTDRARYTGKKEHIEEVISVWLKLAQEYPMQPKFLLATSAAYNLNKQMDLAADYLRKLIALIPESGVIRWKVGISLLTCLKYAEALQSLHDALGLNYKPNDNDISEMLELADHFSRFTKSRETARDLYILTISLRPTNALYHANLAYIYRQLKDKSSALKEAQKAVELAPQHRASIEQFIRTLR